MKLRIKRWFRSPQKNGRNKFFDLTRIIASELVTSKSLS